MAPCSAASDRNVASAAAASASSLEQAAGMLAIPEVRSLVAVGAITAMLGVLLNLILGLSRVWLAMGRRGDMPGALAKLDGSGRTPVIAVPLTGAVVLGLALIGDMKTTWSFSAFTVSFTTRSPTSWPWPDT